MHQYLLFNKPFQVMSQFSPEGDKKTLADYLPGLAKDIYPVGRLDYDSEGLLLLTNDKAITQKLLEPRFAHPRTYWVQVEGQVTDEAIKKLQQGVNITIDGRQYITKRASARILNPAPEAGERNPPIRFRKSIPETWIELTLTEGRNRQVRRMTAAVGYPTLRLIRAAIGKVGIDGINSGEYKNLTMEDMALLMGR